MAKTTWILVAHRAGARLFENIGPGQGIRLKQEYPHEEGRLKNSEINSDRQGSAQNSAGGGTHSYENPVEPVEHLAKQFAKYLAQQMDHGRTENQYDQLVLVAEPRFLGNLRAAIPAPTLAKVIASIDKDLGNVDAPDLASHISRVIRI